MAKKQKHGHYSDKPRYRIIYEYEGDFKLKYEKATMAMAKDIMKGVREALT